MTMRPMLAISLAAVLSAVSAGAAESSLACDRGIVSLGDSKLDLLAKCGPPALEDAREVDLTRVDVERDGRASVRQARAVIEEWSYNFGPQRFLMHVTIERGKVVAIERGGYGYPPERLRPLAEGRPRCEAAALRVGDSKLDLLAKCGEPVLRERGAERPPTVVTSLSSANFGSVEVEIWSYDFGPQQFVQHVTLENGRVVLVESGSYGYAR